VIEWGNNHFESNESQNDGQSELQAAKHMDEIGQKEIQGT